MTFNLRLSRDFVADGNVRRTPNGFIVRGVFVDTRLEADKLASRTYFSGNNGSDLVRMFRNRKHKV